MLIFSTLDLRESLGFPGACLRGFSASLAILPTPDKRETHSRNKVQLFDSFPHLVTLRAQRSERAGASEALVVRDLARGIGN